MNDYLLFDERGVLDPGEACILEACVADDDAEAFRDAVRNWPAHGWALYDDAENLIAWQTIEGKHVIRWFAEWDRPRRYDVDSGRQQRLVERV